MLEQTSRSVSNKHLACCDGDIEDVIQGAQWAIENKDKYGIDIVTSSLENSA